MRRRDDTTPGDQTLDYATPKRPGQLNWGPPDAAAATPDARQRRSAFRRFWLITRVIYLVVCLALMYFVWRFVQGYKDLLENAAGQ